MKTRILLAALLIVGTVFLRGDGCIMKKKVFEIVVKSESYKDFEARGETADFTDTAVLELDQELDQALSDAGHSRDDIKKAILVAGHYGAIINRNSHDWEISGSVDVARGGGGAVAAMDYTKQSVDAAVGKKIKAKLNEGAVDLINTAIADYLNGGSNITLTFSLNNALCDPVPSQADAVDFDWRAWITVQVLVSDEADWPDPF